MFDNTYKNKKNIIVVWIIVLETILRQFIPIGGVLLLIIITIILMILINNNKIPIYHYKESLIPIICLIILCIIQLVIYTPILRAITQAWCLLLILYFFSNRNFSDIETVKKASYIITLVGIISALFYGGIDIISEEVRENMLVDKGLLTIWISFTLCLSLNDFVLNGFKFSSLLMFVIILIADLFIIQSKTSILSFLVYIFFLFVFAHNQHKKRLLVCVGPFIVIYTLLAMTNPTKYIPHTFIVALNQVTGSEIIPVFTDKFDMGTYEARELIDLYCINLFLNNPIYGIGLGNYELIQNLPTAVTECENTYFDLLVNGGLLYGGPVIYILFITLIRCCKRIRQSSENIHIQYYNILGLLISIIVCFRWNDFLYANIFMIIGICYYLCKGYKKITD